MEVLGRPVGSSDAATEDKAKHCRQDRVLRNIIWPRATKTPDSVQMRLFSRLFRNDPATSRARSDEREKLLADLEAEAARAPLGFQGTSLNRAGDLCLKADDRPRALQYYGRAIDAMLEEGHREPARGMAKKIIRIYPEAVRTLCTLTWLDLASRHTAMALVHLQEYLKAAKAGGRGDLARDQILDMAQAVTHRDFLNAAAEALEELDAEDDAAQVRDWAMSGGAPDAISDPDELATYCMKAAGGSNDARKAEGAPA